MADTVQTQLTTDAVPPPTGQGQNAREPGRLGSLTMDSVPATTGQGLPVAPTNTALVTRPRPTGQPVVARGSGHRSGR